jgi:hypothetical protein
MGHGDTFTPVQRTRMTADRFSKAGSIKGYQIFGALNIVAPDAAQRFE